MSKQNETTEVMMSKVKADTTFDGLSYKQMVEIAKANKIKFVGLPTAALKLALKVQHQKNPDFVIPVDLEGTQLPEERFESEPTPEKPKTEKTTEQAQVETAEVPEPVEVPTPEPETPETPGKPAEKTEAPLTKDELLIAAREMEQVAFAFEKDPATCTAEELTQMIIKEAAETQASDFKQKGAVTADASKDMEWAEEQGAIVFSNDGCDILCRLGIEAALKHREANPIVKKERKVEGGSKSNTPRKGSLKDLLKSLITDNSYIKKELIEALKDKAPGRSDSSYSTAISDCKNPQYCGWDTPASVDDNGVFFFK